MGLGRLLAQVAGEVPGLPWVEGGTRSRQRRWHAGHSSVVRRGFCYNFFLSVGFIQTICND